MRIGVLTTSFPQFPGDSAGSFVLGAAQALARRGHSVEVLAPHPGNGLCSPEFDGVRLRWVSYARPRALQRTFYRAGVPENVARAPWLAAGIGTYAVSVCAEARHCRHRWDAVLSHWALPCGLAAAAASGGLPHLAVCHSADVFALTREPIGRALRTWMVRRGTRFWFICRQHEQRFLGDLPNGGERVRRHVSPMGIGAGHNSYDRRSARARWRMQGFNVLALGRLVPIKGLEDAVQALVGWPEAQLWLAGEGPNATVLRRLADRHGVRLRSLGRVSGEAKQTLLVAADVLVVPSRTMRSGRSEGFPTVITEAHAAGLPVVATRTGGIGSELKDGTDAVLVPSGSPDRLARALRRIATDIALRQTLIAAGRRRARRLEWPALVSKVEAMLSADGDH